MSTPSAIRRLIALTLGWVLLVGPVLPAFGQAASSEAEPSWFDEPADPPAGAAEPEVASLAPREGGSAAQGGASAAPPSSVDGEFRDDDPRALTDFRPALDPYGRWVQDPKYGLIWVPRRDVVGEDFAPYVTSGRWSLTPDDEWIWVSDYPFGWVVFHYGRWVWVGGDVGWGWIPGRRYAPAWVVWRVPTGSVAYVGWAPAPPAFVWFGGGAVSLWYTPTLAYVFCPSPYVFSPRLRRHVVMHRARARHIARGTVRYQPARARAGPPPARARVPARAIPQSRTLGDRRARTAARPSTAARVMAPAASMRHRRAVSPGRVAPSVQSRRGTASGRARSAPSRASGRATTSSDGRRAVPRRAVPSTGSRRETMGAARRAAPSPSTTTRATPRRAIPRTTPGPSQQFRTPSSPSGVRVPAGGGSRRMSAPRSVPRSAPRATPRRR